MNAPANIEGLTSLRRVDGDTVEKGQSLERLLRAAGLNISSLKNAVREANIFLTESGVGFSIRLIEERVISLTADRVTDAVAVLDQVDPMLVRIEGAIGMSLDAISMGEIINAVAVDIDDGTLAITLFVPKDHAEHDRWAAAALRVPPDDATLPVLLAVALDGPRLSISDAADLSTGDLLLMPAHAAASLTAPVLSGVVGAYDLTTGLFQCGDVGDAMSDDPAPAGADFLVPLKIHLPERAVSAASLGGLVAGATLPLGPLTDGMPVELRVANQIFARGELVQMGDRFAVLIEERADIAVAPNTAEDV